MSRTALRATCWVAGIALAFATAGCGDIELDDVLEEIELDFENAIKVVQVEDPRDVVLPVGLVEQNETVIINNNVTVITDVSTDLVVEELPDITVLGFENLTGFDAYIRYLADGELQGILVFDGETLLLDYWCLNDVELISEEHFDVFTGELVEAFDITDGLFLNGPDFLCGEALIFTFDEFGIIATPELIDLVR